jgi:Fe-S-cluster containining protein
VDLDEWQELQAALRRAARERAQLRRDVAALKAQLAQLVDILVGRGTLADGHKRLLEKAAQHAGDGGGKKVRLRQYVDKYQVPSPDIDCAARMHLCKARCCTLSFELSDQDLDEGGIRWELDEPYLIRHDADGYCAHIDRATLGCTVYDKRPAACRGFDCRGDQRIWLDFEKRIPAP